MIPTHLIAIYWPSGHYKSGTEQVQWECEGMGPMYYYYGNYYTMEPMHYGVGWCGEHYSKFMDGDRQTCDTGRASTGRAREPDAWNHVWGAGPHVGYRWQLKLGVTCAIVRCGIKGGGRIRVASVAYHGWYGANALWQHMIDDTTIS